MRIGCRSVAFATTLAAVLAFGAPASALPPGNKCSAGKTGLTAKNVAGLLKCFSKATGGHLTVDSNCTGKVNLGPTLGSAKIDLGESLKKPASVCPAGAGDIGIIQPQTNAQAVAIATALAPGFNQSTPYDFASKCSAGKMGCAAKLSAGLLKCHSAALAGGVGVDDTNCGNPKRAAFDACYTKLEAGETMTKPASECIAPNGDGPAIKAMIEGFTNHIANYYSGFVNQTPGCASQIVFAGTSTTGVLDTGWTGQGHNSTVVSEGTVTVAVDTCTGDGSAPACGTCTYHGPVPNGPGKLWAGRCSNDTSIQCVPGGAALCGLGNTCKSFFGTYLPLAAGGVSTCVENTFTGNVTGTTDYATGDSAGAAHVVSRVFTGLSLSHPCPRCLGDATPNDGVKGGTCSGGNNDTKPCDASGSSPNASFGTTSLDCPPLDPGGLIATLPIDLTNTTGNKTKTLSAATSPPCTDGTFAGLLCQCDTCNNAAATPCSSNADCGAGICGGLRCTGGTNNGAPCSMASECPGGGAACSVPGAATAGNQCDGGSTDCFDNPQLGDPNKRTCGTGPSESFCGPVETFRGCTTNAQCGVGVGGAPGDTCSVTRFRDCFDNGLDTEVVTASGVADPPSGHVSDPTLAALFCIGPTTAGAVNAAAGLPGLGRLELGGHATDNGTS
ncbi:MAG: hypothetical protein HY271_00835 [Deltaproteobacteria bacterium]|nr:hypothetical protein [Deltaproteobacteria bacterium]